MAPLFAPRPGNGFAPSSADRLPLLASALFLLLGTLAPAQTQPSPGLNLPAPPPAPSLSPAPGDAPQAATPTPHDFVARPVPREPHAVLPPAEIASAIDGFFKNLEQNEVRKGYTALLAGTRLSSRDEDLTAYITKTQQAISIYGKVTDHEVYDTRFIGTRIIVTTYLSALPVAPLRWRFIYYKADKTWMLINLAFDDSLQDLLE